MKTRIFSSTVETLAVVAGAASGGAWVVASAGAVIVVSLMFISC
jgi:hypothetical protein